MSNREKVFEIDTFGSSNVKLFFTGIRGNNELLFDCETNGATYRFRHFIDPKVIANYLAENNTPVHKYGKWKLQRGGWATCDQCGFTQSDVWDYDNWQNFCGHCGADMRGG